MNHACIPNVHGSYYGEMLIVRAARDIAADEELFINYCPFGDLMSRQKTLDHWGFRCTCRACTEESRTSAQQLSDRRTIYDQLGQIIAEVTRKYRAFRYTEAAQRPESQDEKHVHMRKRFEEEVDELVASWHAEFAKLESTFSAPSNVIPRHENGMLLLNLTQFCFRMKHWAACKDCALQALSTLGFDINTSGKVVRWGVTCDATVTMAALLYKSAKELREPTLQQYEKTVKTIYLIVIGEDVSFEETYWWIQDEQGGEEVRDNSGNGSPETLTRSLPGIELEMTRATDSTKPHQLTLKLTSHPCPIHPGSGLDTSDKVARNPETAQKKKKAKKRRAKKQNGMTVCEETGADVDQAVGKVDTLLLT